MTTPATDRLLADLTSEIRTNTESYIRLESTLNSKLTSLQEDVTEFKTSLQLMAQTQANHGERLVATETRIDDLQEVRRNMANLQAVQRALETQVAANAPVRTPWTAIMSAIVALGALTYAILGK